MSCGFPLNGVLHASSDAENVPGRLGLCMTALDGADSLCRQAVPARATLSRPLTRNLWSRPMTTCVPAQSPHARLRDSR